LNRGVHLEDQRARDDLQYHRQEHCQEAQICPDLPDAHENPHTLATSPIDQVKSPKMEIDMATVEKRKYEVLYHGL
jgi:hypothetical protein